MTSVTYRLILAGGKIEFLLARNPTEASEMGERLWGKVQYVQRAH